MVYHLHLPTLVVLAASQPDRDDRPELIAMAASSPAIVLELIVPCQPVRDA
jgi:hypothetical protein